MFNLRSLKSAVWRAQARRSRHHGTERTLTEVSSQVPNRQPASKFVHPDPHNLDHSRPNHGSCDENISEGDSGSGERGVPGQSHTDRFVVEINHAITGFRFESLPKHKLVRADCALKEVGLALNGRSKRDSNRRHFPTPRSLTQVSHPYSDLAKRGSNWSLRGASHLNGEILG